MNGEVINKIKNYAEANKLDASIYIIGSAANGNAKKEIDLFIVTDKNISECYSMQKDLSDLVNDDQTVVYNNHAHKHRLPQEKDKVHILIHNRKYSITENPIFLREFLKNSKCIYGKDNSKEMLKEITNDITKEDYISYIGAISFGELHSLILSVSSYDRPEDEIREKLKVVKKTVEILKKEFNLSEGEWEDVTDPIRYAESAYVFLDDLVKKIRGAEDGK